MFFSRVALRQDTSLIALRAMLVLANADARVASSHKLLWTLFGDHEGRESDFLWRETGEGSFLVLSRRLPTDANSMFDIAHKPFNPASRAGEKLRVLLRANATISTKEGKAKEGHREDIVTRALREFRAKHGVVKSEQRQQVVGEAAYGWFSRKGKASGFAVEPDEFAVEGTDFLTVQHGATPMKFGVIDMAAHVTVDDPAVFRESLARGFGRSKRYGCGLMVVRLIH